MEWGMVCLGAGLLAFGPEGMRRGLVGLGRRFGLSDRMLGVWLLGPLLAAPFALVAALAAVKGAAVFGAGALVGASVLHLTGLAGLAALLRPAPMDRRAAALDAVALVLICLLVAALAQSRVAGLAASGCLLLTPLVYLGFLAARIPPVADEWRAPVAGRQPFMLGLLFTLVGAWAMFAGASLITEAAPLLVEQTALAATLAGLAIGGAALAFPGVLEVLGRVMRRGSGPPVQAIAAPMLGLPLGLGLLAADRGFSLATLAQETLALLAAGLMCGGFFVAGQGLSRRDGLVLALCCAGFVTWIAWRIGGGAVG